MGDHQAKAALYDALAEAAKALANGRRAELVDVLAQGERSVEELAAGHIRGAISVPLQDLKSRLREIPDGADVVAYCCGPYCVYADDAVRLLSRRGVSAARLEDGFPEWAAARLPVVRSA